MFGKAHVWVPDLFTITGGIQSFSRHLIEAIATELPYQNLRVISKNDIQIPLDKSRLPYRMSVTGSYTVTLRTPQFVTKGLWYAWRERPKLIIGTHLHFGPAIRIAHQLLNTPYILVAHGIDAWHLRDKTRRESLRQADLVLAVSQYTHDQIMQHIGIHPERVKILPNTFAPQSFQIAEKPARLLKKFGFTPQTPVILTVCRLAEAERYKGYDQVIRALPKILDVLPTTKYLLVGKGPDRHRIEDLIEKTKVRDAVVLAGFVPDEELAEYYNLCDIFAMPSKAEGFGIVYLEALACGKPVLAGNKDGSRDALANGKLGILIDPDDTDGIAEEIIQVLRHEHLHPLIYHPQLLRQQVVELFGFQAFKEKVVEYLEPFFIQRQEDKA